jgi:hypothetical protein
MKHTQIIALIILAFITVITVCIAAILILPILIPVDRNPKVSTQDILIDVPSLFGKTIDEIRNLYRIEELEAAHSILPGDIDNLPEGGISEGYWHGKLLFQVFFDPTGRATGFQIIDGLINDGYYTKDWPTLTSMLGINVTDQPDICLPGTSRTRCSGPISSYWNIE